MKKKKIKLVLLAIVIFLISVMINNNVYGYSINLQKSSKLTTEKWQNYQIRPSTIPGSGYMLAILDSKAGVYCLDHTKALSRANLSNGKHHKDVTEQVNQFRYIFGISYNTKRGSWNGKYYTGYSKSIAQNYIWSNPSKVVGSKTGLSLKNSSSNLSATKYSKLTQANKNYIDFCNNNSKIEPPQVKEKSVSFTFSDDNYTIGPLTMNKYSYGFSSACAYVNKNILGSHRYIKTENGEERKGGIIAGIKNAYLVINDNKTIELTKDNFKVKKVDNPEEYEYKMYPLPKQRFTVVIPKNKVTIKPGDTVTIKFEYIVVKARTIGNADIYKITRGTPQQPLLLVSSGIKVNTWMQSFKFKAIEPNPPKINVYISKVEGGGATKVNSNSSSSANPGCVSYQYKNKIQYKSGYRNGSSSTISGSSLLSASRAGWKTDTRKYNNPAAVEKGDKITFTIEITNPSGNAIWVKNVKYTGCKEGVIAANGQKIGKGKTKKFYVTCTYDEYSSTGKKYLKATINKFYLNSNCATDEKIIMKEAKSSRDYFSYKNYKVTIDKYISKVSTNSLLEDPNKDSSVATNEIDGENTELDKSTDTDSEVNEYEDAKDESAIDETPVYITKTVQLSNKESVPCFNPAGNTEFAYYGVIDGEDILICYGKNGKYYIKEYDVDVENEVEDAQTYYEIEGTLTNDGIGYYFALNNSETDSNDVEKMYLYSDANGMPIYGEISNEFNAFYYNFPDDIAAYYPKSPYLPTDVYLPDENGLASENSKHGYIVFDGIGYYIEEYDTETETDTTSTEGELDGVCQIYGSWDDRIFFYEYGEEREYITCADDGKWYECNENGQITDYDYDLSAAIVAIDGYLKFDQSKLQTTDDDTGTTGVNTENPILYGTSIPNVYSYTINNTVNYVINQNGKWYICNQNGIILDDTETVNIVTDSNGYMYVQEGVVNNSINSVRKRCTDTAKANAAVRTENGAEVEYTIDVYNTQYNTDGPSRLFINNERQQYKYFSPSDVLANVKDNLPWQYMEQNVVIKYTCSTDENPQGEKTAIVGSDGTVTFENILIPAGKKATIKYTIKLNDSQTKGEKIKNTATLVKVVNGNGVDITEIRSSSDYLEKESVIRKNENAGDVFIKNIQHSETGESTFVGEYKEDDAFLNDKEKYYEAYAEYGDKVTYGVRLTGFREEAGIYRYLGVNGTKGISSVEATVVLDFPESTYCESVTDSNGNTSLYYKVLIGGKQVNVPESELHNFTYTFTINPSDIGYNNTIETEQRTFTYGCSCQEYSQTVYDKYLTYERAWYNTVLDVSVIVESTNEDDKYYFSADFKKAEYKFGGSYIYYQTYSHVYYSHTAYRTVGEGENATSIPYTCDHSHSVRTSYMYTGPHFWQWTENEEKYLGKVHYRINNYNVSLNEYIDTYNAEMSKYNNTYGYTSEQYNNAYGYTSEEYRGFSGTLNKYKENNPLTLEKYETYKVATRITNTVTDGEDENVLDTAKKYKTRARPTTVSLTTNYGLTVRKFEAVLYDSSGSVRGRYSVGTSSNSDVFISTLDDNDNKKITYTFYIQNNDIILFPGEYLVYYTTLEVSESNLSFETLKTNSELIDITNVNHQKKIPVGSDLNKKHDRYIPDKLNKSTQLTDENFVNIKDIVIAGTVWLDKNKDGYNNNEAGKKDVRVNLYRSTSKNGTYQYIQGVKTNENGLYTFDRKARATSSGNRYYYYVEFEYDGVLYKASEVYGGETSGIADGTKNLSNASTWRQGKSGLPGATSGNTGYLTDSNAYEFDNVRNNFNNNYQTIGYNKAYIGTNSTNSLSYTKSGHISTLNESFDFSRIMIARSFIQQDYNNIVNSSIQNTKKKLLEESYAGYSNAFPETEYLKYVNLGLVEREDVDLSIEADVYSVNTKINGENMTYDFGKNDADSTKDNYDTQENAYKLKDAYYNLSLYKSDFNYRNDSYYSQEGDLVTYKGNESELVTQVTYKITMHNNKITNDEPYLDSALNDIPITTAVNEVAIYYDANFMTPIATFETTNKYSDTGLFYNQTNRATTATYNGTSDQLSINATSNYNDFANNLGGQYNVLYLRSDNMSKHYMKEGDSRDIYVTFTVAKDNTRTLKIGDLKMVAEIGAYTTKYGENYKNVAFANQYAGLVDKDSNPGNLDGMADYNNYEDDTYKANININVPGLPNTPPTPDNPNNNPLERTITGKVWDDARSNTVGTQSTGIQYLGNGNYNISDKNNSNAQTNPNDTGTNADKSISGVKVSLIEVVQTDTGKYYEYPAKDSNGNLIQTRTGLDGSYILKDYMPGYYKVKFTYGDDETRDDNILYNGQDYKSTAYYNVDYYVGSNDDIGSKDNFGYFDKVKTELNVINKSDAQDDEIRRLNVNSYSETMTTAQAQVFSELDTHTEAITKNTWMYADSTIFYVKPEEVKSGESNIDATADKFNSPSVSDKRIWNLSALDFGLEYRPESSIILDKNISTLELVTSDNKTLVKLYFKDDGSGNRVIDEKKSIGNENIQFLPNIAKSQQGFVYVNVDTDILEGCTIKVEYEMDSENNSEVDRINKNLDDIKYEVGANNYQNKVYVSNNYSANGTAAQLLTSKYYKDYNFDTATGKYLKELKKSYSSSGITYTGVSNILRGTGYYGMYLGQTYYTGELQPNNNDIVAQLKVDHILDYIDNDFTYSQSENSTENKLWQSITSSELLKPGNEVLDGNKVKKDTQNYLIDKYGVRYDTDNRSNLILSVDDNKSGKSSIRKGNTSLSRFLQTKNAVKNKKDTEEYTGTISAIATKILSADDLTNGKGLSYENLAEVVQYTSLTGRRTTLPDGGNGGGVIANANVDNWNGYTKWEDDTDATEVITITPPTGLTD